jgi:hypothetical protein
MFVDLLIAWCLPFCCILAAFAGRLEISRDGFFVWFILFYLASLAFWYEGKRCHLRCFVVGGVDRE